LSKHKHNLKPKLKPKLNLKRSTVTNKLVAKGPAYLVYATSGKAPSGVLRVDEVPAKDRYLNSLD
jgi:hypothetical protein